AGGGGDRRTPARRPSLIARSAACLRPQDLGLLRGELLVREDALLVQGAELLELLDRVRRGGRRRLLVGRLLVGGLLGGVLLRPAVGLAARDAVADAGGRSGDHRGAGDA